MAYIIGGIKGGTESLDYSSFVVTDLYAKPKNGR